MASKDHPKRPPREAPPSLMGDVAASMPGAFPQGGIEMTPQQQRIQDKNQKMDGGAGIGTLPGSVAMTGPGMPSGKNGANANGKTDYSAAEEFAINNDNTHQPLSDDTYKCEQRWVFRIMVGLLLMICIVIPVVVLTADGTGGDYLRETDEGLPTALVEDDEDIDPRLIIPGLSNATVQAIVTDHHSPQFMAYLWIKLDPHLQDYEDWRIEQRFAMGVIYYAFGGMDRYNSLHNWLSYWDGECEWMGKRYNPRYNRDLDRPYCNDDGQVVNLYMDRIGVLPPEIELLPYLLEMDLSHTLFHGDFDTFFSLVPQNLSLVLNKLEQFSLVDSEISGTIPAQALSTLSSTLTVLDLSMNKLNGNVPSEFGLLTALKVLDTSGNQEVNGTLPEELGSLVSTLEYMDITETGITGEIPWKLCQKQKAGELEIRADCSLVQCCD